MDIPTNNNRSNHHNIYGSSYPPSLHHRRGVLPLRTTKTTHKLVLFPERIWHDPYEPEQPKTLPEQLLKEQRKGLARGFMFDLVTAYCAANSFKLDKMVAFLHEYNVILPKRVPQVIQYDECLYFHYDPTTKERFFGVSTKSSPHLHRLSISGSSGSAAHPPAPLSETSQLPSKRLIERSEVFVFEYGVVVLWNFSESEEQMLLDKLMRFAVGQGQEGSLYNPEIDPELLHFQYEESDSKRARVYNDMITLKSANPLIKLTISHGLGQSVKLSLFENAMETTITNTAPLPRMMANYGTVKMDRQNIMKIVGKLYRLKMNVNLISNVLDTPEMFWSEPELEDLYKAIRSYLEISQRADLLNSRADVLSDLLSMLTDHLTSNEMTYITWIVIVLIFIAAAVAMAEVGVKLLRLNAGLD